MTATFLDTQSAPIIANRRCKPCAEEADQPVRLHFGASQLAALASLVRWRAKNQGEMAVVDAAKCSFSECRIVLDLLASRAIRSFAVRTAEEKPKPGWPVLIQAGLVCNTILTT